MLSEQTVADCVRMACIQEVNAPKPGNVNCFSDGHNMQVQDFIESAHAIAPVMAQPDLGVGEKILAAIKATRSVVSHNTNLGIVLLFAPLCTAIYQCESFEQLPEQLAKVLHQLTVEDAKACYQAIRLAEAGGLGHSTNQDINDEPSVTLFQAMELAKNHDTIAAQYTNNYNEIFHLGLYSLTTAIKYGRSIEWATTFAYLKILSSVPDTLICRKQSREHALAVKKKAGELITEMSRNNSLTKLTDELIAWDNILKKEAVNPGTTADLIAATLLLHQFRSQFTL